MSLLSESSRDAQPLLRRRRLLQLIPLGALMAALPACTTAPRRTTPLTLELHIDVTEDANPDLSGRPSPVLLSLYRLSKLEAFRALDYFSLSSQPQHAEFRLEESFSVAPGARERRSYSLAPDDLGFGVVAGFRDIEHSLWRVSAELPPLKVSRIKLPEVITRADPVMPYRLLVARTALSLKREERG